MLVLLLVLLRSSGGSAADTSNTANIDAGSIESSNQNFFLYQQSEYPRDCQEVLRGCPSLNTSGIYVIKPDGYPEPFEVYCENDDNTGGWTIIERRTGGFMEFNRLWTDYKDGFGFLSNEYWLGNEKLSYLTNQGQYELRVDIRLMNGASISIVYTNFRIGDEWAKYGLISLGTFESNGDGEGVTCPTNMVYGNCSCQGACEEPTDPSHCLEDCPLGAQGCLCPDGFLMNGEYCVPTSECPCFWSEVNLVIPNDRTFVNNDCTEQRSCTNNQLVTGGAYHCDSNARCDVQEGVRQCYCNDGFRGDGLSCESIYTDCYDAYVAGSRQDGVYLIKPTNWPGEAFNVSCVMSTNGGGWTVFQRRTGVDRQTDFYRNWSSYQAGFGPLIGDFWLGNEKIHHLTMQKGYKLRVDMLNPANSAIYEEWSSITIGNEQQLYRLSVTGYSGNTGNYLKDNNGKTFSTYDRDNDACGSFDCAEKHRGGWWYSDNWCGNTFSNGCHRFTNENVYSLCTDTNLNGEYAGTNGQNIFWYNGNNNLNDCNLISAEMKIRPI